MKFARLVIFTTLLILSGFVFAQAQTNDTYSQDSGDPYSQDTGAGEPYSQNSGDPYSQNTDSSGDPLVDYCKEEGVANGRYPDCCLTPTRNNMEQECKDYEQSGQFCADYPNDAICKVIPLRGGTQVTTAQNDDGSTVTHISGTTYTSCSAIKFKSLLDILNWIKCMIAIALIPLIFALAFLFFLWGVFKFMTASDPKAKQESQKLIWWGIIGLFVMVSVWGLVRILGNTFGVDSTVPQLQIQPAK